MSLIYSNWPKFSQTQGVGGGCFCWSSSFLSYSSLTLLPPEWTLGHSRHTLALESCLDSFFFSFCDTPCPRVTGSLFHSDSFKISLKLFPPETFPNYLSAKLDPSHSYLCPFLLCFVLLSVIKLIINTFDYKHKHKLNIIYLYGPFFWMRFKHVVHIVLPYAFN